MAAKRRARSAKDESRPVVTNDFIYDDPQPSGSGSEQNESVLSDTPEEAVRKLRRRPADISPEAASDAAEETAEDRKEKEEKPKVYAGGIILDENLQPVDESGKRPRKGTLSSAGLC